MWPEPKDQIAERMKAVHQVAEKYKRTHDYGLRVHMVVRDSEAEALEYAQYITSKLADMAGFIEPHLWTGVGRALWLRGGIGRQHGSSHERDRGLSKDGHPCFHLFRLSAFG